MTAPPTPVTHPTPPGPGGDPVPTHPASPSQLAWLERQLAAWRAEGLVDAAAVAAIRSRYVEHRRFTLSRIVLTLGSAFVGLGLIWLVASNLDEMSPLARIVVVTGLWLGFVVAAEVLARRRERAGDVASPVVGAARLLAAGSVGAVVFQAAQSLQVPAYEPLLVGVWALGCLLYAYAVAGLGPVVLGIGLGAFWLVWQVVDVNDDVFSVTTAIAAAALLAVGVGTLHTRLPHDARAWVVLGLPWREVGALLALGALFVAALPFAQEVGEVGALVWVVLGVAVVLAAVAAAVGGRLARREVGLAAVTLVLVVVLALWRVDGGLDDVSDLSAGTWARTVVAVLVYLAVASGYAVLGGLADSGRLTWLATAALVVFTTTQAFAVFAPILSGAVLFLAVGIVLLVTGVLAERGRRHVLTETKEVRP